VLRPRRGGWGVVKGSAFPVGSWCWSFCGCLRGRRIECRRRLRAAVCRVAGPAGRNRWCARGCRVWAMGWWGSFGRAGSSWASVSGRAGRCPRRGATRMRTDVARWPVGSSCSRSRRDGNGVDLLAAWGNGWPAVVAPAVPTDTDQNSAPGSGEGVPLVFGSEPRPSDSPNCRSGLKGLYGILVRTIMASGEVWGRVR
jgi:hypothetical protein